MYEQGFCFRDDIIFFTNENLNWLIKKRSQMVDRHFLTLLKRTSVWCLQFSNLSYWEPVNGLYSLKSGQAFQIGFFVPLELLIDIFTSFAKIW